MRGTRAKAIRRALQESGHGTRQATSRTPEAPQGRHVEPAQEDQPQRSEVAEDRGEKDAEEVLTGSVLGRAEHRRLMHSEKHRIGGQTDRRGDAYVLDQIGVNPNGTPMIVVRRGYGHYSATKVRPWVTKARSRRRAKAASIARRKNRASS